MTKKTKTPAPTSRTAAAVGDLIDSYSITDAELAALGRTLRDTVNTEGWVLVERLLDKLHRAIPMRALREETGKPGTRTRDYYVGQVDFIEEFRALVQGTVARANEADAVADGAGNEDVKARRAKMMMRPGRGPLA